MNIEDIDIYKSEVLGLYLHELYSLSTSIEKECEEIFKEAKIPEGGHMIQVSPEIHAKINNIVINSANIKKLISTSKEKKKKESAKTFKMRSQRAEMFKDLLEKLNLKEILRTDVRNKLEHFEEYLDKMSLELMDNNSKIKTDYPAATYNIVFSDWGAITPPVYPLRLYIANERIYYHLDWSMDIGKVYQETRAINKRLSDLDYFTDDPGGMLIVFKNTDK
ncbi:hypothetical protein [Jeotgalibacillus campisalis]|uniref:Uncharacterized protein n=1 Tax=Jeotgalibacillus campisalis TaxID=220754 RepID=A0A0C2VNX0_9BACL|nr:hypothetical protein [Jeotgalibacillus campisalis]KIL46146.1 hypothetical protein KR50_28210 [Jeotgalibacillus campisalis]